MPIRSIDYQTIIPKVTEVQKQKHIEEHNPQINNMISMNKDNEQHFKDLKRVNETKKAFEGKIKRDNPRKHQGNDKDQGDPEEEKKKRNKRQSIDIRI